MNLKIMQIHVKAPNNLFQYNSRDSTICVIHPWAHVCWKMHLQNFRFFFFCFFFEFSNLDVFAIRMLKIKNNFFLIWYIHGTIFIPAYVECTQIEIVTNLFQLRFTLFISCENVQIHTFKQYIWPIFFFHFTFSIFFCIFLLFIIRTMDGILYIL